MRDNDGCDDEDGVDGALPDVDRTLVGPHLGGARPTAPSADASSRIAASRHARQTAGSGPGRARPGVTHLCSNSAKSSHSESPES